MSVNWKDNVVRRFDSKSTTYDQNCPIQKTVASHLAADLPDSDVQYILEIGCGTGNLTEQILPKYKHRNFCITDISTSMLNRAKEKFTDGNLDWAILDGESPDTSKQYDLIVANMVFQWFEDIEGALDRLASMLKPCGSLFYSIPGANSFKEWKEVLNTLDLPIGILDFPTPPSIYKQENITHDYEDALDFLGSIKNIGAGQARKNYSPLSHKQMKQACAAFDQNHGGHITWHILYGRVDKR